MTADIPSRNSRPRVVTVAASRQMRARPDLVLVEDVAAMVDLVLPVIAGMPAVYQRDRLLVRVLETPADANATAVLVQLLTTSALREAISREVRLVKQRDDETVPVVPPAWLADTLLQRGHWQGVNELRLLARAPLMLPDGRILDEEGFHPQDGALLTFAEPFPPVPSSPTLEDARRAATRLMAWAHDFPFVTPGDAAALLAAILTVVARSAIPGPAPMFVIRSTTPGTGKTLLSHVLSLIATGRPTSPVVFGRDEASTRKAILSLGLQGGGIVLLDNVEGSLGSASLAAALTSRTFTDRLLGVSRMVTVDLGGVTWIATGNNLRLKGDLGRRVIPIDLDALVEHPEDRTGFKIDNLQEHVRTNRAQYVVDALTILRAYNRAGRPSHGEPRIGSFEAWDDRVRGAVMWLGLGDPAAGRVRIRQDGDAELDALRALLDAWRRTFDLPVTARDVMKHVDAGQCPELHDAIQGIVSGAQVDSRALAYALRRIRGRVADGHRLVHEARRAAGGHRWRVERVSRMAGADDADDPAAPRDVVAESAHTDTEVRDHTP